MAGAGVVSERGRVAGQSSIGGSDQACAGQGPLRSGLAGARGGPEAAFYEESLALCREVGDKWGAAFSLRGLGARAGSQSEREQAKALLDESMSLFRELGDPWGI